MMYCGDNSLSNYYQLNKHLIDDFVINHSDLKLNEINKKRYLINPLEFYKLLYKIDNNQLGKKIDETNPLLYNRYSIHCAVNQNMAFPQYWETMLCAIIFNYSEYEDYILNIFDRDTVICSSFELFMKNKNIGFVVPNNFYNELIEHLDKYNFENIDEKINNMIIIKKIKINECIITIYSYNLDFEKLYNYDEYIEFLKTLNPNYKISIHSLNSFQTCLDYFKLNLIDKRYCCLREIIKVILSMYNVMYNIFVIENKKYLYKYVYGTLVSISKLNDDFDKDYNLNLINGDDIILDEHFRINIYNKNMDLNELIKNIKGKQINILKIYIKKFI